VINPNKYYVPPPTGESDIKELLKHLTSVGAGRPLDKHGFPDGPWTPDSLAEAISEIESNHAGVDLRTVQTWFQDNDRGVSPDNIRWLARVFGCDDPEATSDWQVALGEAQARLAAKRRERKKAAGASATPEVDDQPAERPVEAVVNNDQAERRRFSLARASESLFSGKSPLNLPASVWAGCVTLGVLSYIMGVHSVTYSPAVGLHKQVGFLWAPNWTVLELVILPLFLVILINLLTFWKDEGRSALVAACGGADNEDSWEDKVEAFAVSFWTVTFVCFVIVFVVQWSGVHLRALLQGETGNIMVDWNIMAIVRPEVITAPEAIVLSMLAFLYTAAICWVFLVGLVLLYMIAHDFNAICRASKSYVTDDQLSRIGAVGARVMSAAFRCSILGIFIATCIKLQATYLLSDGDNILNWLRNDTLSVLGLTDIENGWLDQRALANFTSFLLLFTTCCVFLFCFVQLHAVVQRGSGTQLASKIGEVVKGGIPWWKMLAVIMLLGVNFLLIGQISGFSILLGICVLVAVYSLYDPMFEQAPLRELETGGN